MRPSPPSRPTSIASALTTALVLALFFWFGQQADDAADGYPLGGLKTDYYNLLTEGFLRGSTALHAKVDPGLLSADPDVRREAPFLLDANLYEGKYYLYYGVTPALTCFVPYRLLSGSSLPPALAVFVAVSIGFLAAAAVWRDARRRYFPFLGAIAESASLLLLGFSTATLFLLTRSAFYEVPIAGGYACAMLAALAIWKSLHANTSRAAFIALAAASLCLGLAVGCRPNYLLSLPVLAALGFWLMRRRPAFRHSTAIAFAAAILPAALMGAGLASYNFARFGDPLEFGFNYGLNSFFSSGDPLFSLRFFWPNLRWTYLTPPELSLYFPFVFPVAEPFRPAGYAGNEFYHGQFPALLLAGWILAGKWSQRRSTLPAPVPIFSAVVTGLGLSSLGFMLLLGIRGNRYIVDFQAAFILVLALAGGRIWSGFAHGRIYQRAWCVGYLALIALSTTFNAFGSIQQFGHFAGQRPRTTEQLARVTDATFYPLARTLGVPLPGPVKFGVTFAAQRQLVTEPLLVAGVASFTDAVYAVQHPDQRVELLIDHHSYGGPRSAPFPIEPGRRYEFEIDLGAFYPPRHHAYFRSFPSAAADQVKSRAHIRVDGRTVLDETVRFYDAPPWTLALGKNETTITPYAKRFSGQIDHFQRLPSPHPIELPPAPPEAGIWRLEIAFDESAVGSRQPLLASGLTGAGNLLFAKILSLDSLQLGLDQWGYGAPSSPPITIASAGSHQLEIFVGPLLARYPWPETTVAPAALETLRSSLFVWIDGTLVWTTTIAHHQASYDHVKVGANPQGFDSANAVFAGKITSSPLTLAEKSDLLKHTLTRLQSSAPSSSAPSQNLSP